MITTIPVHPVTFKILIKENEVIDILHGKDVVIIGNSNTMLNDLLMWGKMTHIDKRASVAHRMTHAISIKHSQSIKRPENVGFYLHKMYMRKMMEYVHAQVMVNVQAMTAIRNFVALYDITEDELSEETIGRLWRRWYSSRRIAKSPSNILLSSHNYVLQDPTIYLPFAKKLEASYNIADRFIVKHFRIFLTKKKKVSTTMINQLVRFTLRSVFDCTQQSIADQFCVSRQSVEPTIRAFYHLLASDHILTESYQTLVDREVSTLRQRSRP